MSWIELLFPKPHFETKMKWIALRRLQLFGFTMAYYFSQVLALVGLTLIYFGLILPLRLVYRSQIRKGPAKNFTLQPASYLVTSRRVQDLDFQRMF